MKKSTMFKIVARRVNQLSEVEFPNLEKEGYHVNRFYHYDIPCFGITKYSNGVKFLIVDMIDLTVNEKSSDSCMLEKKKELLTLLKQDLEMEM